MHIKTESTLGKPPMKLVTVAIYYTNVVVNIAGKTKVVDYQSLMLHAHMHMHRHTDTDTNTETHTDRHTDRHTHRDTHRDTYRDTYTDTDTDTDRQTDIQTHTTCTHNPHI